MYIYIHREFLVMSWKSCEIKRKDTRYNIIAYSDYVLDVFQWQANENLTFFCA